jgi:hydrogenase maturation protease
MSADRPRRIVVGVGNPERGDDAAGHAVAQLLCDAPANVPMNVNEERWEIAQHDGEATTLLSLLDGKSEAFLIDACRSGAPCGTVQRFDVATAPLPLSVSSLSTHGFGLGEAIELGRALGQLPSRCVVYAIEGASFATGAPLSAAVSAAVAQVAAWLQAEITRKSPTAPS